MIPLPAPAVAHLREYEVHASRFREGLEIGSDSRALARALELAGYAMLLAGSLGTWFLSAEGIWVREDGRAREELEVHAA